MIGAKVIESSLCEAKFYVSIQVCTEIYTNLTVVNLAFINKLLTSRNKSPIKVQSSMFYPRDLSSQKID
jgi:hypothetical protein